MKVLIGLLLFAVMASAGTTVFTFSSGVEGWSSFGNADPIPPNTATEPQWSDTNGVDGGYIYLNDMWPSWGFFRAPASTLSGDFFGGSLTFMLRDTVAPGSGGTPGYWDPSWNVGVAVSGGADTLNPTSLFLLSATPPTPTWTQYSFLFSTGTWLLGDLSSDPKNATVASPTQVQDVFGHLTALYISADYSNAYGDFGEGVGTGSETVSLDQVMISTTPEPGTFLLAAAGIALLALRRRAR